MGAQTQLGVKHIISAIQKIMQCTLTTIGAYMNTYKLECKYNSNIIKIYLKGCQHKKFSLKETVVS